MTYLVVPHTGQRDSETVSGRPDPDRARNSRLVTGRHPVRWRAPEARGTIGPPVF